jgi:hypothetical protein
VVADVAVFFGVTIDGLGAGNSGFFESNVKNSSQFVSTIIKTIQILEGYLSFLEIETGQSL